MGTFREPLQEIDTFVVTTIGVHQLFGYKTSLGNVVLAKIDSGETGRDEERATLIVFCFFH